MSKLVWDKTGERFYETGVKNAVLYVMGSNNTYGAGVAWNGITSVSESPSGAEANPFYADDVKYLNLISAEEFGASIGAYTYPFLVTILKTMNMVTSCISSITQWQLLLKENMPA